MNLLLDTYDPVHTAAFFCFRSYLNQYADLTKAEQDDMMKNLIATPAAWYSMNKWMENFRYHITIGWFTVAVSFVCAIVLTLSTVSYFAIRISKVNLADTLKSE